MSNMRASRAVGYVVACVAAATVAPCVHAQEATNGPEVPLPDVTVTTTSKKPQVQKKTASKRAKKQPTAATPTESSEYLSPLDPSPLPGTTIEGSDTVANAQSTAGSITALSRQDIQDTGVKSVQDVGRRAPNVILSDQGSPRFSMNTIRGIGNTIRADYFNTSLGVFLDGVPLTNAEYNRRLGDVASVEILRGPPGPLYGLNTAAGLINITSRPPTDVVSAEVEGTIGNNGQRSTSAYMSGPVIGNTVYGRLFFDYATRDGFTDYASTGNSIDGLESITGSGSLTFKPTTRFTTTISGSAEHVDQGAYAYQLFNSYKNRTVDITPPNDEIRDAHSVFVNSSYDFGAMTLRSITGYQAYNISSHQDLSYNPFVVLYGGGRTSSEEDGDQISQDLRLTGGQGTIFNWAAGVFYQRSNVSYDYLFDMPAFGAPSLSSADYKRRELAGYGEGTLTLFRNLDLTAGVRVTNDAHDMHNNMGISGDRDFTLVTPKFALAYHFNPDQQAYVSATRGARSGGFNRLASSAIGSEYDPEYLWSYEAGVKNELFGRTVTLNAAAFYIDWTDQQIRTEITPGNIGYDNAGRSHSKGFELEASWRPMTGLELSGFLGVTHGEYDEYVNSAGQNLAGHRLANTPDLSGGTAIQYRWPLIAQLMGFVRGEYLYTGDQYFDAESRLEQKAYGLLNFRTGIETDKFSAMFFVNNALDTDYRSFGYRDFEGSALSTDVAIAGPGRLLGVTVNVRY